MRFRRDLGFQEWLAIGRQVAVYSDASLWWLGDWLLYGTRTYGHRYQRGLEVTGLDYQTLRNYARVARCFEFSRRRERLSFHHHAEVCALAPAQQDDWLDRAESGRWSRNELRRRLQIERRAAERPSPMKIALPVDAERQARWRSAAEHEGQELTPWIMDTLDRAAGTLLDSTNSPELRLTG